MTKNIAHRGFSGKYPENTMLAFRKALEAGCDGIELDVHLSRDGELVIIHDEDLDRTTDGSGWVKDHTLAELRALDASAGYRGVYGRNPVPTLREYFELVKDRNVFTNIELKTGVFEYPGIEEKTLRLMDEFGLRERIIISSFNHFSILRFQALAPDVKLGFLTEGWYIGVGQYTRAHGVQCVHPIFNNLTPECLKEIKGAGREINAWTVNTREDMLDLLEKGIDGIIGNFPDLCGAVIREFSGRK